MDIWIRIPFIKDLSIEQATAQALIKSDDLGYLNLNKEQVAQIIGKITNWAWGIDDNSNEGWLPKSMLKINTVIMPNIGTDTNLKITLTIKNQMNKLTYEEEFEKFFNKDVLNFKQVDWDDKIFLVLETNHRVIANVKIDLNEFKNNPQKFLNLELKNFKRSSAVILMQVTQDEFAPVDEILTEKIDAKAIKLISGEILRYTCNATASCFQVYQTGKLSITNYRFLFTSESQYDNIISVPHYTIDNMTINIGQITIITKDLRTIDYYLNQEVMRYVLDKVSELKDMHFCFDYHLAFNTTNDFGWKIYDPEREFARMGAFDNNLYKKLDVNFDYNFCNSYPSILFQPSSITVDELNIVANFRSKRRIPAITWIGKNNALYRCSQPCVGMFYARCKEDEEYIVKAGIKYIIDARPKISARGNKVKGKGFEHSAYYTNCKIHFMNIPNIHKIKASYESLKNIVPKEDFLLQVHNSKWLHYIRLILIAAKNVADFLIYQEVSVLIHCSDGWDRTSQVSSLAQLLIDPFYRTFHGFQVLISKDWLSFGHKFRDRAQNPSELSPIFLQFLDSVYQIIRQVPNEFQFTNHYLLFLAEATYSGKYGTFMANCEKDLINYADKTVSVWKEENIEFFNLDYAASDLEVLHFKTQISSMTLWDYFYQWNIN